MTAENGFKLTFSGDTRPIARLVEIGKIFQISFYNAFYLKRHLVVTFSTNSEIRGPLKQMNKVEECVLCLCLS